MENTLSSKGSDVLTVQSVTKCYGRARNTKAKKHSDGLKTSAQVRALDKVSFKLEPGFYALLGPNGAGKSTLLNVLTASIHPDKGTVLFNGKSIWRLDNKYRQILGYMPQQQNLYPGFSGRQFLQYMCALKGITKGQAEEVDRVSGLVNLSDELWKKLSAYSGGMKQRILAASAMIGAPRVIIMDEPTAGLDPKERVSLRETVHKLSQTSIVLLATHVVSDVESVATQVIIMKAGVVASQGTVPELVAQYSPGAGLEEVYIRIFGEDT